MTSSKRAVRSLRSTSVTALVAACALTLVTTATGPAHARPAAAATLAVPADAGSAATWLAGELEGGLMPNGFGGYDYGLTIDTALALAEIGGHQSALTRIADAMAVKVNSYTTDADFDDPDSKYGGYTAKTAVLAEVAGADARRFGGVDLIERLESLTTDTGVNTGRIANSSGDESGVNTFGQVLAVRALSKEASPEAGSATDFLLEQQCTNGSFRLYFDDVDAATQSCVDGSSTANPDATALAVINLRALDTPTPEVTAAVNKATAWLKAQQRPDGAVPGDQFTPGLNSNTTGLAGWAFAEAGETDAARKAGAWVRGLQVDVVSACGRPKLVGEIGAVAYNSGAFAEARTVGIEAPNRDQWRRAAAQAAPVLAVAPATATAPRVIAPAGYRKAGSTVGLRFSGGGCLTGVGVARAVAASGTQAVTLPAGTARRSYALTNTVGRSVATVSVLGRLRIPATLRKSRVERGRKAIVTIRGLAANEQVKVTWKGRRVYAGTVGATGKRIVKVRVGRKVGKGKIKVTGQFADLRNRTLTVRVTR